MQGHAAACPLRPLTHSRGSRDKRAGAPALRWLSLGRRRSTRARKARAVRFAGSDWPCVSEIHCTSKRPPIRCKAVVRCARCGLPHSRLSRNKRTGAPLRWLSLGRRRSTRACDARALRRNGCGRSTCYQMSMHQRKVSSLRCKAVVRCARCSLSHKQAFAWQTRVRATTLAISLHKNCGAARALATHPRRAAMVVVDLRAKKGHCTSERPPNRCKTVLRRVCCGLQHAASFCMTNARARHHSAGWFSG